jgi:surface protein
MSELFRGVQGFDSDISGWNVSGVTDMRAMFATTADGFGGDARSANPSLSDSLGGWNVSSVQDMSEMFAQERHFNGDVSAWDVSSVRDMSSMFWGADAFNGDVSQWNVASVRDMSSMFAAARAFNGDVSQWNVASVRKMQYMFDGAQAFNGSVACWDVSNVVTMGSMFDGADAFHDDLRLWRLGPYALMDSDDYNSCFDSNLVFDPRCVLSTETVYLYPLFSRPQCGCPRGVELNAVASGCVVEPVQNASCSPAPHCPRRADADNSAVWVAVLLAVAGFVALAAVRLSCHKRPPPPANSAAVLNYKRLPARDRPRD